MRRRDFLLQTAMLPALLLQARRGWAMGDESFFVPAVARFAGSWDGRLKGLGALAWELSKRTSVESLPTARALALTDPALFRSPFLYLGSDAPLPSLSTQELSGLRRFLDYGGFLLAETNRPDDPAVDASFRRELGRVLPSGQLARIPQEHVIYKSFYLLDHPTGRVIQQPFMEMIKVGKRAAVVYSQNDMAGAWSRDAREAWDFECVPGGEGQRAMAFHTGINLCMYALCLDYKEDAVHLPYIMKRRR
jgi:hypothetical protein